MTKQEAIEANLLSLVRIVGDLQTQVRDLEHICRMQDASIVALNERLTDAEAWIQSNGWKIEDGR